MTLYNLFGGTISIKNAEKEKSRYISGMFKKEEGKGGFRGRLVMGNKYSNITGEGDSIEINFILSNDRGPSDYNYRLNPFGKNTWTGTWESVDKKGLVELIIIPNLQETPQLKKMWKTLCIGKPASRFHR